MNQPVDRLVIDTPGGRVWVKLEDAGALCAALARWAPLVPTGVWRVEPAVRTPTAEREESL